MSKKKKSLTVNELIKLLQEHKEKYSGSDEVEASIFVADMNFSGLTIYDAVYEDGPYCTLYIDDKYDIYNNKG